VGGFLFEEFRDYGKDELKRAAPPGGGAALKFIPIIFKINYANTFFSGIVNFAYTPYRPKMLCRRFLLHHTHPFPIHGTPQDRNSPPPVLNLNFSRRVRSEEIPTVSERLANDRCPRTRDHPKSDSLDFLHESPSGSDLFSRIKSHGRSESGTSTRFRLKLLAAARSS
jgi:hypothetical protein